jgi:hypothetical protein
MDYDIKLLARLLNYGRTDESGYPTGMEGPEAASGVDHLQTNQMGDNPMVDPALDESTGDTPSPEMVEAVEQAMRRAGVGSALIALEDFHLDLNGNLNVGMLTMQPHEYIEIAEAATGKTMEKEAAANFLLDCFRIISRGLDESLQFEELDKKLSEFRASDAAVAARFTHTIDSLGDVTIADSEKGTSVHLRGEDALELLGQIPDGASEGQLQHVLSQYQHVMETPVADVDHEDYVDATDTVSELKALDTDIASMRAKLQAMMDKSAHSGDVNGAFAANVLSAEVDKLETALNDYLNKGGLE